MTQKLMALALLMMCGILTACGATARVEYAVTDPAISDDCPRSVERPGDLPPRALVTLPDGTVAVTLDSSIERETMLTRGVLAFAEAWKQCKSVVIYNEDRDGALVD